MVIEIKDSGHYNNTSSILVSQEIIIEEINDIEINDLKQLLQEVYEAGKKQNGFIIKEEI